MKFREQTVAFLVSHGAATGASTDPSPEFPLGRSPADLASVNGHKGISGFLAESSLTSHLSYLSVNDSKEDGAAEISGTQAIQTISERTATPVTYGVMPDALSLKDSLTAVRNATQAADRIHQMFRMQSFEWRQLNEYSTDGSGLLDERAISLLAGRSSKSGPSDGQFNSAAVHIQKKFRGWKKRKEFLLIRQRIVKIQVSLSLLLDFSFLSGIVLLYCFVLAIGFLRILNYIFKVTLYKMKSKCYKIYFSWGKFSFLYTAEKLTSL